VATTKCCAKIASDLEKPDGLTVVPPGQEAQFLAPLPLGRLPGLGAKTEARLRSWNVTTIGGFAALPADLVGARFGAGGLALHAQAQGQDDRPVSPPAQAKSISREHTFGQDCADLAGLRHTLLQLSDDCCRRLRADGRLAATVSAKVRNARFETRERSRTLARPTDLEEEVWPVAWELAHSMLQHNLPVRLVGVGLANLGEPQVQLALDEPQRDRLRRLHRTVDEIRERMGAGALRRASDLPAGPRGEHAG
jgi:DNA polymerase-4